ncbi:MAG: amino acid permease [Gemmatimonadales bacterium]|nr:amino acid permease [Gemmatimonadales bacterium]
MNPSHREPGPGSSEGSDAIPPVVSSAAGGYAARLGLFSGTMLVVGGIIGSGIFLSPAVVAQRVGTAGLTLGAWGLGALVALIGAFVYAELGARLPRTGGTYVYLREAYGRFPAFMYGWALFFMIGSGAIAAVSMTSASYAASLLGWSEATIRPTATVMVVLLVALNIAGVKIGAIAGNILTVLKLAAIAILIVAAFALAPAYAEQLPVVTAPPAAPDGVGAAVLAMAAALVPVLFTFGGWQQSSAVAEELRDPARTLPRALIGGVLIVVAAYLLVNLAYLRALGVDGLAASTAPAADAMALYLGPAGRTLIAAGILVSTLGFNCMVILMSARVSQTMAADGLFLASMAQLHPVLRTPIVALVAQALVILVLIATGSYGQLLDYVVFADWIFFTATAATIFVWRARERQAGTSSPGVRVPLHPFSTLIFMACGAYVVVGSVLSNPGNAVRGVIAFAIGVPAYLYWQRRS